MPVLPVVDLTQESAHPSGVQCIEVVKWFDFLLGSAIAHIWTAGNHRSVVDDLKLAQYYLDIKIKQLESDEGKPHV